jgi:hypothetical protein
MAKALGVSNNCASDDASLTLHTASYFSFATFGGKIFLSISFLGWKKRKKTSIEIHEACFA